MKMGVYTSALLSLMIMLSCVTIGSAGGSELKDSQRAKNVILMIGDGMGISQETMARIEKAGWNLSRYADTWLYMDSMEHTGILRTFSANSFVTDSAPASTAMATGHKTNNGVIGQDAIAIPGIRDGRNLTTILELAEKAGLSTGVVTTTRITHATPAAFYAHVDNRDNESEIAEQLLTSGVEVALGGGMSYFIGKNDTSPLGGKGKRTDDRNLIEMATSLGYTFVYNGTAFRGLDANSTERLLGIFENSHMEYELVRARSSDPDPSLAEMTEKAIYLLSKNPKGFFLMVEGGRIDHACHERSLENATMDTLAFDEAVGKALDFAMKNTDTLVIVTADHECGGLIIQPENLESYESGGIMPVFGSGTVEIKSPKCNFLVEMDEATHTGADVTIRATGPRASLVRGVMDNTQVFSLVKEALGL
ncbi:alkaline phosphatase [Methanothrix sp.]|uniref:alkaline phosphatase n=1 Tax=Methanothrix sp. TaxID=90426 RepID=UPI0034E1EE20